MIAGRLILWYIFFAIISIFCLYIFWIKFTVMFWLGIFIYNCVFFVIHRAYASIKWKYRKKFGEYSVIFFYKFSIWVSIFLLLFGYFIYHQNYLFPAKMPRFILENNDGKNLVFQAMSHVGSEDFYESITDNISQAKKNDYVLFYEGVRPGTEENEKKFDDLLGIQLDSETYKLLAALYGIEYQNQAEFLWIENENDTNVDLTIDEIVAIYEEKYPEENETSGLKETIEGININKELSHMNEILNPREKFLLRQYNIALMNFMIKHEKVQNSLLSLLGKENIFSVILEDRNAHLAETVENSEEERIFIMYGLLHFQGFFEDLQKTDPSWKILYTNYNTVFTPPVVEYQTPENTEQEEQTPEAE